MLLLWVAGVGLGTRVAAAGGCACDGTGKEADGKGSFRDKESGKEERRCAVRGAPNGGSGKAVVLLQVGALILGQVKKLVKREVSGTRKVERKKGVVLSGSRTEVAARRCCCGR